MENKKDIENIIQLLGLHGRFSPEQARKYTEDNIKISKGYKNLKNNIFYIIRKIINSPEYSIIIEIETSKFHEETISVLKTNGFKITCFKIKYKNNIGYNTFNISWEE